MRRSLVAGNWKMHASTKQCAELVEGIVAKLAQTKLSESVDAVVCPPLPYLALANNLLSAGAVGLGAQNLCAEAADTGAYTGEVSAAMLLDLQCQYVIVGHSERRQYYAETDVVVAKKLHLALESGLTPILCIGETAEQHEQGATNKILQKQLAAAITLNHNLPWQKLVIAYEPIWAIGTGNTATPDQAQQVHAMIRAEIAQQNATLADDMRIVYGGSVKPDNAIGLMTQNDIDGALVGGASLNEQSFVEIIQACNQ